MTDHNATTTALAVGDRVRLDDASAIVRPHLANRNLTVTAVHGRGWVTVSYLGTEHNVGAEELEAAPAAHRPTTVRDVFDALAARQVDADMRTAAGGAEWCVIDVDDNGTFGGWVDAGHDPGVVVVRGLGVLTDKPFTDAEAAAEYIAGRVTEIVEAESEFPRCDQCGDPIDYCQGHGSY
ncbi:hypothetical protein SEA_FLOAT294_90 [Gordonia phage Float294]|nr:hypothetical protein SEA_FLOAT294_90 [Gordonia phage Float294]